MTVITIGLYLCFLVALLWLSRCVQQWEATKWQARRTRYRQLVDKEAIQGILSPDDRGEKAALEARAQFFGVDLLHERREGCCASGS